MTATVFDCLCAGIVVADHVCEPVAHLPAAGELVLTGRMDLMIGGCAANVAVDLAKLGTRAAVAGTVGQDVFGRFIRERLTAAGVHCDHLAESPGRDTSGTLIVNVRGEDRRFIHSIGANDDFTGEQLSPQVIGSARVLYVGGYGLCDGLGAENVARLFRSAREAGVATLLDVVIPGPGDYRRLLDSVLPLTDVFLPNEDEARLITGLDDPAAQAETFREMGAKTVVITRGGGGATVIDGERPMRFGCYPVEFLDGTGSGDAFDAGYIYGLLNGADTPGCVRYGSALGASCVRAIGATTGVFSTEELEAFIAAHELPFEG